jgi:hypothetical protein
MKKDCVIFPNLLKCQEFTDDDHWKDIIMSCACNKLPKGLKLDSAKATLFVRYEFVNKSQNETFSIPADPRECYDLLMYIFKDLLNLKSENDIEASKLELEKVRKNNDELEKCNIDCTWKQLKPRSLKNNLLMNYSIELVQKYKLDVKEANKLYKLILMGFQFKNLTSNDVNYKSGKIISISGIKFRKGEFILTNNQGSLVKTSTTTEKEKYKVNQIEKGIDKFIKDYKNFYQLTL